MENFHDLAMNRRSIRKSTEEPIDPDHVRLILETALLAPTSKSSSSWRFVVVDVKDMRQVLEQCKPAGAAPVGRCPLAVVVCGDTRCSDPWIEDASIAAAFIQLEAADLGLGSCWIQVRGRFTADGIPSEEYVAEALNIPEGVTPLCIITLGHKDELRRSIDPSKLEWEKVKIGHWSGE